MLTLKLTKGVPQGSIVGPCFMNALVKNIPAKIHFYADDTVMYTHAPSVGQAGWISLIHYKLYLKVIFKYLTKFMFLPAGICDI